MIWWLKKQLLKCKLYVKENLLNENESLIIWYPVALCLGMALYYALSYEISAFACSVLLELVLLLLYLTKSNDVQFKAITYLLILIIGLCIAKADAMHNLKNIEKETPEIMYLRGHIKHIDFNSNHKTRLLLNHVKDMDKSYKGDFRISTNLSIEETLKQGQCVELIAKIPNSFAPNPISNYDFKKDLFYKGISKIGYAISPIFNIECENKENYFKSLIMNWQKKIEEKISQYATPSAAPIIKAITTGNRIELSSEITEKYRISGLAHFFAISGMHMGMIAFWIFLLIRLLFSQIAEGRYDLRKPAAIMAILGTGLYFLISGQSVSCIRAFVMTIVVLIGVLINRRAISFRMWGFALLIISIMIPSAVTTPGFLMSFAATLGLVAFYEKNNTKINQYINQQTIKGKITAYIIGILLTDFIATIMTLPYSIYFFNQISIYTSLGNLLAGPIIVFWIMPSLLLFLISIPLGITNYSLKLLSKGIDILTSITNYISTLPNADIGKGHYVFSELSIVLITLGLLWLCIWQAKWRKLGLIIIAIGVINFVLSPKPDFIFDKEGSTYAYKNQDGILLSTKYHKNRFLEKLWTKAKRKDEPHIINCTDTSCTYKNRIEFSKGYLKFDSKIVPLKNSGYIDLKTGVHYSNKNTHRIWD